MHRSKIINVAIVVALFVSVLIKVFRIGSIPAGNQFDEIGAGYDAWSLLHYGVDRWRISWPVYFLNYGSGQNALYTYLLVPIFAFFGFTQVTIRIPALISSFFLLFGGIGIINLVWKENWNLGTKKTAILIYVLIYGFSPYTQLSGRLGLESLLMLGFSTFSLYITLAAFQRRKLVIFFLSGIAWGVTLYTYAISYLVIPLFLLFSLVSIYKNKMMRMRECVLFFLPLFILAIPLILEQYVNIFDKNEIKLGIFTVTRLIGYRSNEITLSNIPQNLFLTIKSMLLYDWLDYNTIKRYWTFYPISVPFFIIGLLKHVQLLFWGSKEKWKPSLYVFAWFASVFVVGMLLGKNNDLYSNPNTNKINAIFFATMFYITLGLCYFIKHIGKSKWRQCLGIIVLFVYGAYSLHFVHYYFVYHKPTTFWAYRFPEITEFVKQSDSLMDKDIYTTERFYPGYITSELKSPYEFNFSTDQWIKEYGSWKFGVDYYGIDACVKQHGKNAMYLFREVPDWTYGYFQREGFKTKKDGALTLYYTDD